MCENFVRLGELQGIRDKARDQAYYELWKSAFRNEFMENETSLIDGCSIGEINIMDNYIMKKRVGTKFIMVTINPADSVNFHDMYSGIHKCLKKVWIGNWLYCFEQRGITDEDLGMGMHIHMCLEIKKYKRPSDMHREIYNTFKKFVGSKKHVNIRKAMIKTNFVNYILGTKKDISGKKEIMSRYDQIWRSENDLEKYYSSDDHFWGI